MAGASAPISTLSRLAFKDALLELEVAARKTREASSQAMQKLFQSAEKSLGVEVHRSLPINSSSYSYSSYYYYLCLLCRAFYIPYLLGGDPGPGAAEPLPGARAGGGGALAAGAREAIEGLEEP